MTEMTIEKSAAIADAQHEIDEAEKEWMSAWLAAGQAMEQMEGAKDRLSQAHEAYSRAKFS